MCIGRGIAGFWRGLKLRSMLKEWREKLEEHINDNRGSENKRSLHTGEVVGAYDLMGWYTSAEEKV